MRVDSDSSARVRTWPILDISGPTVPPRPTARRLPNHPSLYERGGLKHLN